MNTINLGSNWNKWDMHLHSPYSHLANKYNCTIQQFCQSIRANDLKVIGLTNYFIIEEHEYNEIVAELKNEVFVIPNIEFRTNDKNKDNEFINVHVLFNPGEISISQIQNTLSRIKLNNVASATSVYCNIESLRQIGFDAVTVSIDELSDQLKEDFDEKDYIIAGVPSGYGGFHPDKKPRNIQLAMKIDGISKLMLGRADDRDFFLSTTNERAREGFLPKPNFVCSDAHTISDIGTKFTWVKSDSSFEGLKQILFEPRYRIAYNDQIRKPHRIIEKISFNYPKNTQLKNSLTGTSQEFCLSRLTGEIAFSPYFTCLIGGRGAGKSTIINVIAEKLGEKSDFFKNNKILVNGAVLGDAANDMVTITGTGEIEFISQGRVEELSQGNELTSVIFNERIRAIGSDYQNKEDTLSERFKNIADSIKVVLELEDLNSKLKSKISALENDKKIIAAIENSVYRALSSKVREASTVVEDIKNSKVVYAEFINKFVDLRISSRYKRISDD